MDKILNGGREEKEKEKKKIENRYAATGMETMLYTKERKRFCLILRIDLRERRMRLGIVLKSSLVIVISAASDAIFKSIIKEILNNNNKNLIKISVPPPMATDVVAAANPLL